MEGDQVDEINKGLEKLDLGTPSHLNEGDPFNYKDQANAFMKRDAIINLQKHRSGFLQQYIYNDQQLESMKM